MATSPEDDGFVLGPQPRQNVLKKSPRIAVFIGDLHCGSTLAILPPDFKTHEGNAVKQNAVQSWLWKCWRHGVDKWLPPILAADPYVLVLTGDCIEGVHHGTKQIISPDVQDHFDAAVATVAPLSSKAGKTFIVKGTEVHTGNHEAALGKLLRAEANPETGKYSWDRLSLGIAGVRIVCFHHISAAMRPWTEASGLGIFLAMEQVEAAKNGEKVPRVLVCAHRHKFGQFQDSAGLCIVTHPWQATARYGFKVAPASRFKPGFVVMDWRGRNDGELPEVHQISYSAPSEAGATA